MNVPTIREVMTNPALFGNQFGSESYVPWVALLCAFHGLALNREERRIFEAITRRAETPQEACSELWLIIGRRGGKSYAAALLAVYYGCFMDYRDRLAPGEVATIRVMAADKDQARAIFRYVTGLIDSNPMVKAMVQRQTRTSIELDNRCVIEVGTASFRSTRGYSFAAVLCDELAFWHSEDSANPDVEVLNAVRPGLATLDGKLIVLSSPYSKRGELWEAHKQYFGEDGPILVAQAASNVMNPTLPQRVIDAALEKDRSRALAEYMAEFRADLEQFLNLEVVESATRDGPLELPRADHRYFAFVDPSGGGRDEFCIAIGHREENRAVVDLVRGLRGVPAAITAQYAELLKAYGITEVTGDRYAGTWPGDEFHKHGIVYRSSDRAKSDLYINALPAFNSGRVEIPDDARLINQLASLERRTSRAGRDSVDHPSGGHDDRANVVAGLVSKLAKRTAPGALFGTYGAPDSDPVNRGYRKNEGTHNRLAGMQSYAPETEHVPYQMSDGTITYFERKKA